MDSTFNSEREVLNPFVITTRARTPSLHYSHIPHVFLLVHTASASGTKASAFGNTPEGSINLAEWNEGVLSFENGN